MGTTLDAMEAGGGRFGFTLVIEGFDKLITDAADLSAVITAWAGTGWTSAIPGLRIEGSLDQELRPWTNEPSVSSLKFIVSADEEQDTLGEAVFKVTPSAATRMTSPFPATSAPTTLVGQSVASLAASGTVYLGPQRIEYSSKTGSTTLNLDADTMGTFSPVNVNGKPWKFPRGAPKIDPDTIGTFETRNAPKISTSPRTWVGRWVGLWMHRIRGEVWDEQDEAELLFAGQIVDVQDSGGATVIEAEDVRAVIANATLLSRQFSGYVKKGIRLVTGEYFVMSEGGTQSDPFVVVASGASGAAQINAGYYETADFISHVNQWMADEFDNARTTQRWSMSIGPVPRAGGGVRTWLRREGGASSTLCFLHVSNSYHMAFLGFAFEHVWDVAAYNRYGGTTESDGTLLIGSEEPYLIKVLQPRWGETIHSTQRGFELEDTTGSWVENGEFLPHPYATFPTDSGDRDYGFLKIDGNQIVFAKHTTDTLFEETSFGQSFGTVAKSSVFEANIGRRWSEASRMLVEQVVFVAGTFADVLTKLLSSIDGNGVNHADYDAYEFGAAIPWSLLGDEWLASVNALEQVHDTDSIVIYLDRPTRLKDVILPDLILRFAFFIFKGGKLRLVSPQIPNASLAEHTFDETNKGAPAGQDNDLRTAARVSREFMRNIIKIEYDLGAEPPRFIQVVDQNSIAEYGLTQTATIRARNASSTFANTGVAVEQLASSMVARTAALFGRPVRLYRRTINGSLFHVAPGDTGVIDDDFARDPTTGLRGVEGRAVTVLRTSFDFGHEGGELSGEVDLMFWDEDRTFPFAPAAEVDNTYSSGGFTSGWHSGNVQLKLQQHAHSRSIDVTDIENFTAGDEVRVTEVDPSNPASADDFADTIAALPGSDVVTLTNGFGVGGRPAFSASKRYRMTYGAYTTVDAGQKLFAFLADEGDGQIQNAIEPNQYGEDVLTTAFTRNDGTENFSNQVDTTLAEGRPLSSALIRDLIRNSNALVNYHTAYSLAQMDTEETSSYVSGFSSIIALIFKVPAPFAPLPAGMVRNVSVGVRGKCAIAASVSIQVTISPFPPRGSSLTAPADIEAPYTRHTFTTSSTTFVEMTAADLVLVSSYSGHYYVTVEIDTTNSGFTFGGLTRFQLGPLEEA